MSGWGGLPVILVGLIALLLLGSAAALGERASERGVFARILTFGGLAGAILFGVSIVARLVSETIAFLGWGV